MLLNADAIDRSVCGLLPNGKSSVKPMYEAESVSVIYPVGQKKKFTKMGVSHIMVTFFFAMTKYMCCRRFLNSFR